MNRLKFYKPFIIIDIQWKTGEQKEWDTRGGGHIQIPSATDFEIADQ
jgi:hypothetical protein